jgi:hypothetical protein
MTRTRLRRLRAHGPKVIPLSSIPPSVGIVQTPKAGGIVAMGGCADRVTLSRGHGKTATKPLLRVGAPIRVDSEPLTVCAERKTRAIPVGSVGCVATQGGGRRAYTDAFRWASPLPESPKLRQNSGGFRGAVEA